MSLNDFSELCRAAVGMTVSYVWRGYGSALFLELGQLTPTMRSSGEAGAPDGEISIMIEWGWRIEQGVTIQCGCWSDEALWQPSFAGLVGHKVTEVTIFGVLPEITLWLESDLRVSSFMVAEGDPVWVIFDRRNPPLRWYASRSGRITMEIDPAKS